MELNSTAISVSVALAFVGLGFGTGVFGTLIGAGGGFLLVPILLLINPSQSPATITAISLAVVFCNAYSGTWAYVGTGRIDYSSGVLFAVAGIPGAILGAWVVHLIPAEPFAVVFSLSIFILGGVLLWRPLPSKGQPGFLVSEANRPLAGSIGSAYVGLISSLLGIGGGILHVPFLVRVLGYRPHVATATSHFVLAITALAATVAHLVRGELSQVLFPTALLAVGMMAGAPVGAALSTFLRGPWIVRLLAAALVLVAARLIWRMT